MRLFVITIELPVVYQDISKLENQIPEEYYGNKYFQYTFDVKVLRREVNLEERGHRFLVRLQRKGSLSKSSTITP